MYIIDYDPTGVEKKLKGSISFGSAVESSRNDASGGDEKYVWGASIIATTTIQITPMTTLGKGES